MSSHRRVPPWLANAIAKCLSGATIGLLIAFALLPLLKFWFPSLEEWSIDRGMRLGELVRPVGPRGREVGAINGYLFIDIDPGDDAPAAQDVDAPSASAQACEAVQRLEPDTGAAQERWDCAPWRPINRHLLSGLVNLLRARAAKLVVVDVDLSAGGYPLPAQETAAFIATLRGGGPPAFAVLPARPVAITMPGDEASIIVRPALLDMTLEQALSISAPALPYSGDRTRRYVDCYGVQGDAQARSIPSVATRAQELLQLSQDPQDLCHAGDGAPSAQQPPRILFTLPTVPAQIDSNSSAHDAALWSRYHLFYDRCLAADLGKADSPCSQASLPQGKIVVIGASSRARGDRHLTPFGEMAGAEVVLNAIRSRLVRTPEPAHPIWSHMERDLLICVEAAAVWMLAFILLGFLQHANYGRVRTVGLRILVVACTICVVLWVSVTGSFNLRDNPGNLDLMIPVLAFGLQSYTDGVRYIEAMIERPIRGVLHAFGILSSHEHN